MRQMYLHATAAACLLAFAMGDGRAAVADLTELSIEQLMQVEVQSASKFRQQAIDAPAAVSVVTADDIRSFGYRTLGEVIGSMRGVYVSYDRYFSYVGVRGFARAGDYNSRILLLVDGIRQNDSVFNQAMVGTESPLDVDLIDRVEFVPGAGSSVYGSNAFFGVINVITKNGSDYRGSEAAAAAGNYGTGKLRLTHGAAGDGGADWLLSGSSYYQRGQDHFYPAHGGRADDLDSDRSGTLFAKLRTAELTLGLIAGRRSKENPTASFGQTFNARGSESVDESASLSAEYRKALSTALSLTARGYAQEYRYRGDFIYGPPLYTNRDEAEGRMWGGELQFTSTHFRGQRIVFGAEYRRDDGVRQKNFDVAPYVSYLDSRVSDSTRGIYVQDEIAFGERVLLNVGVRHDNIGDAPSATSPRLALIYKPLPQTAVKLLYGEAYRPPNAFERYYATDIPSGYRTNPNLKPETIRSRELVLEHALSPSQRIVASLYRNDVANLIAQQYDAVADRFYFDNVASVRAKGAELEWTGRLRGGVVARVGASWQRAEDGASGTRLTNSPARLFKANLSAPFRDEQLRAGLEVQAMSSRKTELGSVAPGFAIANLTLIAPKLARNLEVSASLYNLFDRRYFDPAGSELDPIDRVEQNGRNVRLKLSYRF
ncbi:MAG: TonB-dependent receptor [Rhodocyclales bacterium]|nr:TonB-dependent receptor [Rhodocyclales bacterium]